MLIQKIEEDFKQAMREKNEITVSSLRNLKAEIKNIEIEKKSQLSDDEVIAAIKRKVKQHKDSIESFKSGARLDLVEMEEKQMEVLKQYLPAELSEEKIREVVKKAIAAEKPQASDFGKVMKMVMAEIKGSADGNAVSAIVKEEMDSLKK